MNASHNEAEARFAAEAKANGWSDSQAEWIGRLAAKALPGAATPAEAYKAAERQLSAGYFNQAVEQGKGRLVAFLTVIDLEKQVIERAGGTAPAYGEEALKAAYAVLEEAAARGAGVEEQLATAFAALRQLLAQTPG